MTTVPKQVCQEKPQESLRLMFRHLWRKHFLYKKRKKRDRICRRK